MHSKDWNAICSHIFQWISVGVHSSKRQVRFEYFLLSWCVLKFVVMKMVGGGDDVAALKGILHVSTCNATLYSRSTLWLGAFVWRLFSLFTCMFGECMQILSLMNDVCVSFFFSLFSTTPSFSRPLKHHVVVSLLFEPFLDFIFTWSFLQTLKTFSAIISKGARTVCTKVPLQFVKANISRIAEEKKRFHIAQICFSLLLLPLFFIFFLLLLLLLSISRPFFSTSGNSLQSFKNRNAWDCYAHILPLVLFVFSEYKNAKCLHTLQIVEIFISLAI